MPINERRFLAMLREQALIGKGDEGGLNRPALSEADMLIRDWFKKQAEANHLDYKVDGAANQSAILHSKTPHAKTLLLGSHFDSVPNGGTFDGALGMICALETALSIKDMGLELPFHLEVINFTDEEGTLVGLLGSGALVGLLGKESLEKPRGGRDVLEVGMKRANISQESILAAKRASEDLRGYIEVHIEQGSRLEDAVIDIGIVTRIVGIRSYWLKFIGEAAHAGTMPMKKRRDAFWGAASFALKARDIVMQHFGDGVVNFGDIHIKPAAFNIVPEEAKLGMEFRHGDASSLDTMEAALLELADVTANEFGLKLSINRLHDIPPAPMSENFVKSVEQAADNLQLSHTRLLSFAGHDAQSLAKVTEAVMIFLPSVEGISHNPNEFSHDKDCINAANVMLETVLNLGK